MLHAVITLAPNIPTHLEQLMSPEVQIPLKNANFYNYGSLYCSKSVSVYLFSFVVHQKMVALVPPKIQ